MKPTQSASVNKKDNAKWNFSCFYFEKTDCQYLPGEKIASSSLKFYNARCSDAKLASFVLKAWMKAIL